MEKLIEVLVSYYASILKEAKYLTKRKKINKKQDAEDLVQETYFRILSNLNNITYESNAKLRGLLYITMKRLYISELRKKHIKVELSEDIASTIFTDDDYNMQELTKIITSMKLKNKEVVKMYIEGYKYREIASILNINMTSVHTNIRTMKDKLIKL